MNFIFVSILQIVDFNLTVDYKVAVATCDFKVVAMRLVNFSLNHPTTYLYSWKCFNNSNRSIQYGFKEKQIIMLFYFYFSVPFLVFHKARYDH